VLGDGTYDAIVIDAGGDGDGNANGDTMVLCLTITAGERKGEVVEVQAVHLQYDPLDLLAMPCILVVRDGEPKVVFD
jgi:hypothetical protein